VQCFFADGSRGNVGGEGDPYGFVGCFWGHLVEGGEEVLQIEVTDLVLELPQCREKPTAFAQHLRMD
jgi:hypothetical protein